jgi:hypothetical protein
MRKKKGSKAAADTVDPLVSAVQIVRELALDTIAEHERLEHNGEFCHNERMNLVAYLAYCLGLGDGHMELVTGRRRQFEQKHGAYFGPVEGGTWKDTETTKP